jgi:hypothetical protein
MSIYTFDIRTAKDFLVKKVIPDYHAYSVDPLSANKALTAAMSTFHLIDWVLHDSSLGHSYTDIGVFRTHFFTQCSSLKVMHDIANGGKHAALSRPKTDIAGTHLHEGEYSIDYDHSYNVSSLIIVLSDGSELIFELELQNTIFFWVTYFKDEFNIEVPVYVEE